jgi:hypothetical protein
VCLSYCISCREFEVDDDDDSDDSDDSDKQLPISFNVVAVDHLFLMLRTVCSASRPSTGIFGKVVGTSSSSPYHYNGAGTFGCSICGVMAMGGSEESLGGVPSTQKKHRLLVCPQCGYHSYCRREGGLRSTGPVFFVHSSSCNLKQPLAWF